MNELKNSYTFENYKSIIHILYEEHVQYTKNWLENTDKEIYNLKKTQVKHICSENPEEIDGFIDEKFLSYLDDYRLGLGFLNLKILLRVKKETNLIIEGRTKSDDAILLKLHRKRFEDGGAFPLNKYLNDLLGFRIIDDNYENNIKLLKGYLDELKKQNKRFVHKFRKNGEYIGYHVYFMGINNYYFPMELQIWDSKNERKNFESHEIYKKDYTYWPKIYKEG